LANRAPSRGKRKRRQTEFSIALPRQGLSAAVSGCGAWNDAPEEAALWSIIKGGVDDFGQLFGSALAADVGVTV